MTIQEIITTAIIVTIGAIVFYLFFVHMILRPKNIEQEPYQFIPNRVDIELKNKYDDYFVNITDKISNADSVEKINDTYPLISKFKFIYLGEGIMPDKKVNEDLEQLYKLAQKKNIKLLDKK